MIIGKRINDRYKILQLIGGGGMSNVYLAHDMILNRDVAIKILRYDSTNEEEYHRRFQREALSATSLMHPNIVSIYDVGEDGDVHFIVMEYIKGKTLKQYIQEFSPLSPARSVHIMKQLTSAIAHAHENHIIHRDIKPQNILVDMDGNVKVTDFGIATTLSATSYTKTNSVIGTVHYLSPEQARGGIATKKSDIYALGIVLYELLTGEVPFSGESAVSIALKHLQTETPSIRALDATIPQSVENVVLKATAKKEDHRYNSVEEMQEDLETVLSPNRLNEPKFAPPFDDEVTKAIPIINESTLMDDVESTKVLSSTNTNKVLNEKENKVTNEVPKKKNKKKLFAIIAASIAIVVLLIILIFNLLTPRTIEIPDVANKELEEAKEILETTGFVIGKERQAHDEEVEEGDVIRTDPKAGLSRVKGTKIDLIVSLGTEKIEVDDYVGKSITQVTSVLDNLGLKYTIEEIYSEQEPGTIIEQQPVAGEEVVAEETSITFTVSQGKRYVTVANLEGYNESELKDYAYTSGLDIEIDGEVHSNIPQGSVVSQSPAANAQIEEGGTVTVKISAGPQTKKEEGIYVQPIEIPYEPVVFGEVQTVEIYIQDKNHPRGMEAPAEVIEITEDTIYNIELVIEEGSSASYQIIRGTTRIDSGTIPYDQINENGNQEHKAEKEKKEKKDKKEKEEKEDKKEEENEED